MGSNLSQFDWNVLIICFVVIKDWSVSAPYSYLAGGMTYQDGKLTVPTPGRYYIYAQIYYHNNGRVFVKVNNKPITMMQPQQVVKGQVVCTLVGCSTWRLVTSSRWLLTIILIEMAPKFTCTPITVTLAHFWSELFFCYLKLNKHCHRGANTTSPNKLRDVSLKRLPHF